jgi:hypothetical protein
MKHIKRYNEGLDEKSKQIKMKIKDAAYGLGSFGTMTKQASFINGANWAIQNLTIEEIQWLKQNADPEDHSFFGF